MDLNDVHILAAEQGLGVDEYVLMHVAPLAHQEEAAGEPVTSDIKLPGASRRKKARAKKALRGVALDDPVFAASTMPRVEFLRDLTRLLNANQKLATMASFVPPSPFVLTPKAVRASLEVDISGRKKWSLIDAEARLYGTAGADADNVYDVPPGSTMLMYKVVKGPSTKHFYGTNSANPFTLKATRLPDGEQLLSAPMARLRNAVTTKTTAAAGVVWIPGPVDRIVDAAALSSAEDVILMLFGADALQWIVLLQHPLVFERTAPLPIPQRYPKSVPTSSLSPPPPLPSTLPPPMPSTATVVELDDDDDEDEEAGILRHRRKKGKEGRGFVAPPPVPDAKPAVQRSPIQVVTTRLDSEAADLQPIFDAVPATSLTLWKQVIAEPSSMMLLSLQRSSVLTAITRIASTTQRASRLALLSQTIRSGLAVMLVADDRKALTATPAFGTATVMLFTSMMLRWVLFKYLNSARLPGSEMEAQRWRVRRNIKSIRAEDVAVFHSGFFTGSFDSTVSAAVAHGTVNPIIDGVRDFNAWTLDLAAAHGTSMAAVPRGTMAVAGLIRNRLLAGFQVHSARYLYHQTENISTVVFCLNAASVFFMGHAGLTTEQIGKHLRDAAVHRPSVERMVVIYNAMLKDSHVHVTKKK